MEIRKQIRYIHSKNKDIIYYEVWRDDQYLGSFQTSKEAKRFINDLFGVKNDGKTEEEVEGDIGEVSEL